MIKQIQLRGISRTPSDRATADGGLAESLNVHLSENELAPTIPEEDATEKLGLPPYGNREYIYIHKGNGYTNYITLNGIEMGAYVDGVYEVIGYMETGEVFQSATSIGNTVIIMGDKHPYYALFKDGHYIFLGSKIPMPTIQITPEPVTDVQIVKHQAFITGMAGYNTEVPYLIPMDVNWTDATWNAAAAKAEANNERFAGIEDLPEPEPGEDEEPDIMTWMKKFVTEAYAEAKSKNVFIHQVMVLYGVQLYNGSYITSVPYLMPGGFEFPFYCRYLRYALNAANLEYIQYGARYPYRIKAKMLDYDEETIKLWSDIIMSIDFFITPIIPFDISKEKVMYVNNMYKQFGADYKKHYFDLQPCSKKYESGYLKRVLANGSDMFRRAESISTDTASFSSTDRLAALREGTELDLSDYIADQDLLLTQPALADFSYDMRNAERTAKDVSSMNNRMLMSGVTETIPPGSPVFPAAPCYLEEGADPTFTPYIEQSYMTGVTSFGALDNSLITQIVRAVAEIDDSLYLGKSRSSFAFPQPVKYLQIVYHIQGRERYVVRGQIGSLGSTVASIDGNIGYFGFLTYPDTRCKSVDIFVSYDNVTWYGRSYEMREHPKLPCSYMYIGVDRNILWDVTDTAMRYNAGDAVPLYWDFSLDLPVAYPEQIVENLVEHRDDVLLLSDVDTPWFVPIENQYQFQATEIIGTALATKALSTGQFGQFPLYVFTDNGIWAMQMNQLGTFSSSHAVSMDVAKRGTILALDQAVAFVTDKGLLLITGSDIRNLSPNMNGEHYVVNSEYKGEIKGF